MKYSYCATVYRKTLTKGKVDEFDESGSNRQIKTNQYRAIAIRASVFYTNLLYKNNIIRGALVFCAAIC